MDALKQALTGKNLFEIITKRSVSSSILNIAANILDLSQFDVNGGAIRKYSRIFQTASFITIIGALGKKSPNAYVKYLFYVIGGLFGYFSAKEIKKKTSYFDVKTIFTAMSIAHIVVDFIAIVNGTVSGRSKWIICLNGVFILASVANTGIKGACAAGFKISGWGK